MLTCRVALCAVLMWGGVDGVGPPVLSYDRVHVDFQLAGSAAVRPPALVIPKDDDQRSGHAEIKSAQDAVGLFGKILRAGGSAQFDTGQPGPAQDDDGPPGQGQEGDGSPGLGQDGDGGKFNEADISECETNWSSIRRR